MAKSNNNVITHGLSGKVGDIIVFSQRGGKTIISKAPSPLQKLRLSKKSFNRLLFTVNLSLTILLRKNSIV